jgi:hypothetical protein
MGQVTARQKELGVRRLKKGEKSIRIRCGNPECDSNYLALDEPYRYAECRVCEDSGAVCRWNGGWRRRSSWGG